MHSKNSQSSFSSKPKRKVSASFPRVLFLISSSYWVAGYLSESHEIFACQGPVCTIFLCADPKMLMEIGYGSFCTSSPLN